MPILSWMYEGKHETCSNQVKHNESVKILGPEELGERLPELRKTESCILQAT